MKKHLKRILSLVLALSMVAALGINAAASDALGDDLTEQEVLLNKETTLATNVFWSSAYSDLRTEHYITYEPNRNVIPMVTYGDVLTKINGREVKTLTDVSAIVNKYSAGDALTITVLRLEQSGSVARPTYKLTEYSFEIRVIEMYT